MCHAELANPPMCACAYARVCCNCVYASVQGPPQALPVLDSHIGNSEAAMLMKALGLSSWPSAAQSATPVAPFFKKHGSMQTEMEAHGLPHYSAREGIAAMTCDRTADLCGSAFSNGPFAGPARY